MNMMPSTEIFAWSLTMIMGSVRIAPTFFLLPFLSSNIISRTIRMPVMLLIGGSLWPYPAMEYIQNEEVDFLLIVAREFFIGLVLAAVFALPFWIMHGVGSLIDNQRGATISSTLDPMTGVDTSELANLFNLFAGALFLLGGGLVLMLETFATSYQICEPMGLCTPALMPTLGLLTKLMVKVIILASPVVATLLMTEILLGLLSRFAPQLNAFSISLTVKSAIAFFVIILYFSPVLPDAFKTLWFHQEQLSIWLSNV